MSWWHLVTDPQTTKSKIKPPYATLEDIISIWMQLHFLWWVPCWIFEGMTCKNQFAVVFTWFYHFLKIFYPRSFSPRYPCYEQLAFGQPVQVLISSALLKARVSDHWCWYWWILMTCHDGSMMVKTQLKSGVMRLALMLMPFFVWARQGSGACGRCGHFYHRK